MVNFILIAFCIVAGMVFRAAKWIPADAHKGINTWILYVALPAVSFKYIPQINWSLHMLLPVVASLLVWAGAWVFMELYCRLKNYSQRSRSTLELASGYNNTSFIGFPLVAAYFGEKDISIAIVSDQSAFILLSVAGIICALKGGGAKGQSISTRYILKRLISFPPFIACVLALLLSQWVDLSFTEPFFDKLAVTVGPLALFSIGLQLKFKGWRQQLSQISTAVFYKLLIAPALVLLLIVITGVKGEIARVSLFEAAMPTLVTSGIIAEQFRLNTRLINLIIGASIIIGLVTTALWNQVLHWTGIG